MQIVDLLKQIPTDTKERVKKATNRFGPSIREAIRAETRLQLTPRRKRQNIPFIKGEVPTVVDRVGYPKLLGQRRVPEGKEVSALLSLWKPWLIALRDSSLKIDMAMKDDGAFHSVVQFIPDMRPLIPAVGSTHKLSEMLLRQIAEFDLVKEILDINEDILGHYFFNWKGPRARRSSGHVDDEAYIKTSTRVVIYWGVVGLVAMALGVSVEDLTVVVLAHEVAHAYTHLGFDIDQYRWGSENFFESEHEVKEGLAQYYTDRVLRNLEERVPGAKAAFEALLPKQPEAYREHVPWVEGSTPEAVRNTLVLLRKSGPISKGEFGEMLSQITMDYRK